MADRPDSDAGPPLLTTILLIDPRDDERRYWAHRLTLCSSEYCVLEALDVESGLHLYKTNAVDCVVVEMDLGAASGFSVLVSLVPLASQPEVPVVILTRLTNPYLCDLARLNGAQAALMKDRISGEDLDHAIRKAMAAVGPKKSRNR